MKFPLPFAVLSAAFALSATVHAQTGALFNVRVHQNSNMDVGKDRFTTTQKRVLQVYVTNSSREEAAVKIKYTYFGHTLDGHDITAVDSGEKDATVKPAETQEVDMPTTSQVYAMEHFDIKAKKRVPAMGNKITGYGVQVLSGDKVVAESYDPPSMKDLMGKAKPAAAASPAPAKKGA